MCIHFTFYHFMLCAHHLHMILSAALRYQYNWMCVLYRSGWNNDTFVRFFIQCRCNINFFIFSNLSRLNSENFSNISYEKINAFALSFVVENLMCSKNSAAPALENQENFKMSAMSSADFSWMKNYKDQQTNTHPPTHTHSVCMLFRFKEMLMNFQAKLVPF